METDILTAPSQHIGAYRDASARTSTTRVDIMSGDESSPAADAQPALEPQVQPQLAVSGPDVPEPAAVPQTPQIALTFLLVSGRRRTMSFDPETTVGRVKELVWNAWPSELEWQEERPPAPLYLRVLYLGKILQDDETLIKLGLPSYTPPPVGSADQAPPHAPTIKKSYRRRPVTVNADATPGGTAHGSDSNDDGGAGCCCVVC